MAALKHSFQFSVTASIHSLIGCLAVVMICSGCDKKAPPAPVVIETGDIAPVAPVAEVAEVAEVEKVVTEVEKKVTEETSVTESTREPADTPKDGLLRHAVFFSFKEDSSEEDLKTVTDAFEALPSKIEEIIDFQWGTNNSPEGKDDGFTHCFLLTFKNDGGRKVYLPHPAHKAFGDVLRPHMKDVFVIDYWGTPPASEIEKELKHAVFFKFKDDASEDDVKEIEEAFAALPSKIDAIKAFEWGRNNSPEKHDDGFTHCFMVTFDSEEGRDAYLPHAEHQAFVEVLLPVLDKVRVLDFWTQE